MALYTRLCYDLVRETVLYYTVPEYATIYYNMLEYTITCDVVIQHDMVYEAYGLLDCTMLGHAMIWYAMI